MSPAPQAAAATLAATIAAVWREECGVIVGALLRLTRDLGLAEECAQDALVAALEHWPVDGLPVKPGAWLMTTARHRALDQLRRRQMLSREHEALALDLAAREDAVVPDFVDALDMARQDEVGDDLLRLMFIACHPVLTPDARVALTLRLLGGLDTAQIARAFLVPEATVAQRLVRAKRTLSASGLPFEAPRGDALAARGEAVLEVIYLVFNEGYAASDGAAGTRPDLCAEALRLGRLLLRLQPRDAEAHAQQALMALQAARLPARQDAQGRPMLLADQDRGRWDAALIDEGLQHLDRAEALAFADGGRPGPRLLQAAISACHARSRSVAATDWHRIAALYGLLADVQPSPVVALNRAVAVSMAEGPAAGLALVQALADAPRLRDYPWLYSTRADLLARLGRPAEAAQDFRRAAELTRNASERAMLMTRAEALAGPPPPG